MELTKISMTQARKLYNNGGELRLMPSKMDPHSVWYNGGLLVSKPALDGRDFDKLVNEYSYYNCTPETGKRVTFYVGSEPERETITGAELYTRAAATLPAQDIAHHSSDLYLRKTPESEKLVSMYEHRKQVTTFIDNIDRVLWYDVPFAYMPYWADKTK